MLWIFTEDEYPRLVQHLAGGLSYINETPTVRVLAPDNNNK